MKTASKNSPEMNIPIAVMEFGLEPGYKGSGSDSGNSSQNNASSASSNTVRFGMDRDEVAALIDQLEDVQKAVDSATS